MNGSVLALRFFFEAANRLPSIEYDSSHGRNCHTLYKSQQGLGTLEKIKWRHFHAIQKRLNQE